MNHIRKDDVVRWSRLADTDPSWRKWGGDGPFIVNDKIKGAYLINVTFDGQFKKSAVMPEAMFVVDEFMSAVRRRRHDRKS